MSVTVVCTATLLMVLWCYYKTVYNYWKTRGVAGPTPLPFFGNYASVFTFWKTEEELIAEIYLKYRNEKFVGIFFGSQPVLIIRDLDLQKQALVKDHQYFHKRQLVYSTDSFRKIPTNNFKYVETWRTYRKVLLSLFSKAKFDTFMPVVEDAFNKSADSIEVMVRDDNQCEMISVFKKMFNMTGGALALGVKFDSFKPESELEKKMNAFTNITVSGYLFKIVNIFPGLVRLIVPIVNFLFSDVLKYFHKIVLNNLNEVEFSDEMPNSLLKQFKIMRGKTYSFYNTAEQKTIEVDVDDTFIAQNAVHTWMLTYYIFSIVNSLILYFLALNEEVQDKTYAEIKKNLKEANGKLTLDAVFGIKYLEALLEEIFRIGPCMLLTKRICSSRYTFPGTNLTIDEKVFVYVPKSAVYKDPRHFSEPTILRPERFLPEQKAKLHFSLRTLFGEGPRACPGNVYSKFMIMTSMVVFLQRFKVSLSDKTRLAVYPDGRVHDYIPNQIWLTVQLRE